MDFNSYSVISGQDPYKDSNDPKWSFLKLSINSVSPWPSSFANLSFPLIRNKGPERRGGNDNADFVNIVMLSLVLANAQDDRK